MEGQRVKLTEVNPYLVCVLCQGYLVDATTVAECLHSFCRSCIFRQLERESICPICKTQVHNTKLYRSLRPDKTLQDIVYKLVPGLFHNEMQRRRDFYKDHPYRDEHLEPERRGVGLDRLIYSPDDQISLSLEFYDDEREKEEWSNHSSPKPAQTAPSGPKRYLQCPAGFKMVHLKKFLRQKYGLNQSCNVDILYKRETLPDSYSLMDVAYIYTWKRNSPMRFYYRMPEVVMKQLLAPLPKLPQGSATDAQKNTTDVSSDTNSSKECGDTDISIQQKADKKPVPDSKDSNKILGAKSDINGKNDQKVALTTSEKPANGLPSPVQLNKGNDHKFLVPQGIPLKNGITDKKNGKVNPKYSVNRIASELAENKSQNIARSGSAALSPSQQQFLQKQKQLHLQKRIKQQQINQQKQQQLQLKQQQLQQQKEQIENIIKQQKLQHQMQQQQLQQFHQQQLQQLQNQQIQQMQAQKQQQVKNQIQQQFLNLQHQQQNSLQQHQQNQHQQLFQGQQQIIIQNQAQQLPHNQQQQIVDNQQSQVMQSQPQLLLQSQQQQVLQSQPQVLHSTQQQLLQSQQQQLLQNQQVQVVQIQQEQQQILQNQQKQITPSQQLQKQPQQKQLLPSSSQVTNQQSPLQPAQNNQKSIPESQTSTNQQPAPKDIQESITKNDTKNSNEQYSINKNSASQDDIKASQTVSQTKEAQNSQLSSSVQQSSEVPKLSSAQVNGQNIKGNRLTPSPHAQPPVPPPLVRLTTPPPPIANSTPPPQGQLCTPPHKATPPPHVTPPPQRITPPPQTQPCNTTVATSPQPLKTLQIANKTDQKPILNLPSPATTNTTTEFKANLNLLSGGQVQRQSQQLQLTSQQQKAWRDISRAEITPVNGSPAVQNPQVTLNTSNGSVTIMAQPKTPQNALTPQANQESPLLVNGNPTDSPRPQGIHQNLPRTVLPKSPFVNGKPPQKAVPQRNISGQRLNNNIPELKNGLIQQSNINNRLPTFQKAGANARKIPGGVLSKTGPTLDQRIQQLYNSGPTSKPTSPGEGKESRLANWLNNRFKPQSPKPEGEGPTTPPKSDVSLVRYKRKLQELQKDCEITQENPRPDDPKRRRDVTPDVSIELMRAADMKKLEGGANAAGGKKEKRPVPGLKSIQEVGGKRKKEEDSALDLSNAKPEVLRPQLPWLVNRPPPFVPRQT